MRFQLDSLIRREVIGKRINYIDELYIPLLNKIHSFQNLADFMLRAKNITEISNRMQSLEESVNDLGKFIDTNHPKMRLLFPMKQFFRLLAVRKTLNLVSEIIEGDIINDSDLRKVFHWSLSINSNKWRELANDLFIDLKELLGLTEDIGEEISEFEADALSIAKKLLERIAKKPILGDLLGIGLQSDDWGNIIQILKKSDEPEEYPEGWRNSNKGQKDEKN